MNDIVLRELAFARMAERMADAERERLARRARDPRYRHADSRSGGATLGRLLAVRREAAVR